MNYEILHDGVGAENHDRETGRFEVRFGPEVKRFNRLLSAFFFYYQLRQTASLWDTTADAILLERKIYLQF